MQTPLQQGTPRVLPSGGVRLVTSRDEGQPGEALQEEVGREGPARDGFVTPVQGEPSAHPWSVHVSVCKKKKGSWFSHRH